MAVKKLRIAELLHEKSIREGKTTSPTDLAGAIGVSHNTILSYVRDEGREPSYSLVMALCRYFECTPEELVVMECEDPELVAV